MVLLYKIIFYLAQIILLNSSNNSVLELKKNEKFFVLLFLFLQIIFYNLSILRTLLQQLIILQIETSRYYNAMNLQ